MPEPTPDELDPFEAQYIIGWFMRADPEEFARALAAYRASRERGRA